MQKTYIFGHQKPDTDSVCASIALSYLKNQLGYNTVPKVLGHVHEEAKYVLDYFGVKEPEFLNDVKVQVRNMKIHKNLVISENSSILDAFLVMQDDEGTGVCVVDENKKLKGLFTLKDLARELINGDKTTLKTNIENIAKVLEGHIYLQFDEEIEGRIVAATYQSQTIVDVVELGSQDILLVGDRYKVLDYAIASKVQLIILTGNLDLPEEFVVKAKENKINIICTGMDTYEASSQLILANYVSTVLVDTDPITVDLLDYRTDFLGLSEHLGHTNYPVLHNKTKKCLGLLKVNEVNQYDKLHVILVDHNGRDQSVEGIEEAIIDEIIDHHNLVNVGTNVPINFRSMPVGSTCTIIYQMYLENHVEVPQDMAGLMMSAILSDTLLLKSVTTTDIDRRVVEDLASIANVNVFEYGKEMVKAGFSIKGKKLDDLLEEDVKTFRVKEQFVGISQIFTMDYDDIKADMDNFVSKIDDLTQTRFTMFIVLVTDILKNGSYVFYNRKSENVIRDIFNDMEFVEGTYIPDLLSRKKQLVPDVMEVLER